MHRYRFVLSRPFQLIPVLLGISLVTFVLVRLIPGDPARLILGTRATPQALERVRMQFGLDEPLWLQYLYFLRNLGQGEMGRSILYRVDVLDLILGRLEPTIVLVGGAVLLSLLICVPLATLSARRQGSAVDAGVRLTSTVGLGLPNFWLAIMLIILFSVTLGWFPVSGYGSTLGDKLHHMALPWLTVALSLSAVLTRSLRASLVNEMRSDVALAASPPSALSGASRGRIPAQVLTTSDPVSFAAGKIPLAESSRYFTSDSSARTSAAGPV